MEEQASTTSNAVKGTSLPFNKASETSHDFRFSPISNRPFSGNVRAANESYAIVEASISRREKEVKSKEKALSDALVRVEKLHEEVVEKLKALRDRERVIEERESRTRDRCGVNVGFQVELREKEVLERGVKIKEGFRSLELKKKEVFAEFEAEMLLKKKEMIATRRELALKETQLGDGFRTLKAKENEINEAFKRLELTKKEVDERSRVMTMKETELGDGFQTLKAKENEINEGFKRLELTKKEVDERSRVVTMKETECSERVKEVEEMKKLVDERSVIVETEGKGSEGQV